MTRLVVALPAEARSVVTHFELKPAGDGTPFRVYTGDGVELIVSGVGKAASAAAAGFLFASTGEQRDRPWVNLGIGGSAERPIGETVLAHKVEDVAGDRSWYPPLVSAPPCATATVRTVDRPRKEPAGDAVYEMEAAGFCETASRFSTAELVHVVKVVSDHGEGDFGSLSGRRVSELIEGALPAVEELMGAGRSISDELARRSAPPTHLESMLGRWHFTVTERRRLERLLRRLPVAAPGVDTSLASLDGLDSGSAVLRYLEEQLGAAAPGVR